MTTTSQNEALTFDPNSRASVAARDAYRAQHPNGYVAYVYSDAITLAVRVALATRRPLLLRGDPGCGKSSLALDVALCLGRHYYDIVVSSRTQARDLLWQFDAVKRLGDAQLGKKKADISLLHRYVEPGVLWWAFAPKQAKRRGYPGSGALPKGLDLAEDPKTAAAMTAGAVVLVDEIDKADPDMPNDLLVPLGAMEFRVEETGVLVRATSEPLIVITTNEERDLPPAFLRRCVLLEVPRPDRDRLRNIALAHFPQIKGSKPNEAMLEDILTRFEGLAADANSQNLRAPGTAELIDTVRACLSLGVERTKETWASITRATLWKHRDAPKSDEAKGNGKSPAKAPAGEPAGSA